MSKGSAVNQFKAGDRVQFNTNIGNDVYTYHADKNGNKVKTFSHKNNINRVDFGKVVKLHKSGRQGSAEIRPEDGGKKITRKLQHVSIA